MRYLFLVLSLLPSVLCSQDVDSESFLAQYAWIADIYPDCNSLSVEEYHNGAFAYIYVSDGKLYFQDGTFYCGDGVNRDCRQLYGLMPSDVSNLFSCGEHIPPIDNDEDVANVTQSIELYIDSTHVSVGDEFCVDLRTNAIKDLLSFQFQIQLSNQNVLISQAVGSTIPNVFTLIEDDIVKFLWFSEDLLPIQIEMGTSIASICFTVIDNVENTSKINLLNTNRLFAQFITADATGDFFENTDVSLSGGIIRIEEAGEETVADVELNGVPLTMYPWMREAIASHGCEGTSITEYDFGTYSFFYISSSQLSQVFSQDGIFYCRDTPSRDCKAFYQLTQDKIVNQWLCEE